ncbi:MAG: 3-oxoacyl-ACP reductase FabG [Acidobacteria bacterium]|nr:3-oxoacyl-ACP reductase FabG [Acidobacteriota bacterium]
MSSLAGRIAIVTGASRGIGRAIAERLAREGATIVAVARGDQTAAVADGIRAGGGRAEAARVDVTDAASGEALLDDVVRRLGRIDVLVNNAGIARDQLLIRMKREDWDAVVATNLTAAFTLTKAAVRPMMKQRWGRIVCISSVVGQMGNAGQANYAASKAGLIGFAKALARELAPRNITVNVVAPGFIDTDMTRGVTQEIRTQWEAQIPLGRFGTPDEIASAVCFLASDEASYITGQVLSVNGGMYM